MSSREQVEEVNNHPPKPPKGKKAATNHNGQTTGEAGRESHKAVSREKGEAGGGEGGRVRAVERG